MLDTIFKIAQLLCRVKLKNKEWLFYEDKHGVSEVGQSGFSFQKYPDWLGASDTPVVCIPKISNCIGRYMHSQCAANLPVGFGGSKLAAAT